MSAAPDTPVSVDHARSAGWYDLFAFLSDRRRILRDPACMLRSDAGLAFGPAAFARFLLIVVPFGVLGAVGLVTGWIGNPPPSAFSRVAAIYAELRDAMAADREPEPSAERPTTAWRALHMATIGPQIALSVGPIDEASRRQARDALLDGYRTHTAALAPADRSWIARRLYREYEVGRRRMLFYRRYNETGASNAVNALLAGFTTLMMAKIFRWLMRRQRARFPYADHAERAFLYYVSARLTWIVFAATLIAVAAFIAVLYQRSALAVPIWFGNLAVGLASGVVYFRSGRALGSLLAGHDADAIAADPALAESARRDGRSTAWRLLWVFLLLQAFVMLYGVVFAVGPSIYYNITTP